MNDNNSMMLSLGDAALTAEEVATLPPALQPTVARTDLTKEEQADWTAMETFANSTSDGKAAEASFLLFINQRRSTRAWAVGCAVVAGSLGVLGGYLAWGR